MSRDAIIHTTKALQNRIASAVGGSNPVHLGPPIEKEINGKKVSLFLFHLQVNAAMRNDLHLERRHHAGLLEEPLAERHTIPFDLRYLITVFGVEDAPLETLGKIIERLHAQPTLSGATMHGQVVRVTPEPFSTEDLSRVWGLFPQDAYRTSVVYLASPVLIQSDPMPAGPPVVTRDQQSGLFEDRVEGP